MQPVTQEKLEELIREAKEEGKDTSQLERTLDTIRSVPTEAVEPPAGNTLEEETPKGRVIIESTGPARREDFD